MTLSEFDMYIRGLLLTESFSHLDSSKNGWQIECGVGQEEVIVKIAFAVDACLDTIHKAKLAGANVLFVHHGFFWGHESTLTGGFYQRIKALRDENIALYAVHLPLDADPILGHNAQIADLLGLIDREPLGDVGLGVFIGCLGALRDLKSWKEIRAIFEEAGLSRKIHLHEWINNSRPIKRVGIISGGGIKWWSEAYIKGVDLFITGEVLHQYYHIIKESGFNAVAIGHCYSERWGMIAMAEKVKKDCHIPTCFLEYETGL